MIMVLNIVFIVIGIILLLEFVIMLCSCGRASDFSEFWCYPFGIPMPSMFLGILLRVALVVVSFFLIYKGVMGIIG